jgi:hypothetical protein
MAEAAPARDAATIGGRWSGLIAPGLLLLTVVLFFWRAASFQGALFHYDLIGFNAPVRAFFFGHVARGQLPLWCPDVCGGFPLFAEGQAGPLYPPNHLLFTWLPPWVALNASLVLHIFLAALGMFFYLARGHRRGSAAIGALSYCLSSYLIFHLVHLMLFQSACLAPWLFFFVDRWLDRRRVADLLGGALTLAVMFAAGHQQGPILVALALAAFLTALAAEEALTGRARQAGAIAGAGVALAILTALITAVVAWGLLDLLQHSARRGPMDASFVFGGSLLPRLAFRLASPFHHGRRMDDSWLLSGASEKEIAVYLGLAAFLFVPVALAAASRRRDRAHLVVVLAGLLLMLGAAGPFDGLVRHLPILNRLRIPARFILPVTLSASYLIASGLDALAERRLSRRAAALALGGGALAWAALAWGGALFDHGWLALWSAAGDASSSFGRAMFNLRHDLLARTGLAAALALAGVGLHGWRRGGKPATTAWGLAIGALVLFDLGLAGYEENPTIDPQIYAPGPAAQFVSRGIGRQRLFSEDGSWSYGHGGWAQGTASFADSIAALPESTPLLFGLRTANCGTPLVFERTLRVLRSGNSAWMRQLGVKYAVTRREWGFAPAFASGEVKVYESGDPPPLLELVPRTAPVSGEAEAFARTEELAASVPPTAVVENGQALEPAGGEFGQQVERVIDEPDRRVLRLWTNQPAFLLVRENYHPAWRATLNGRPAPLYRANYLFFGMYAPAGDNTVELAYQPAWFRPLLALSLASFFAVLGLALFLPRLRRACGDGLREASPQAGARATAVIIALFLAALAVAASRHPELWRFAPIVPIIGR